MSAVRKIDDFTRDILSRSMIDGSTVKLPPGKLDRSDYERVNKALTALGGKWNRKAGGHVFPFPAAELLADAVANGAVVDRKQALQFFETPADIAERMAELAEVAPGDLVLEPSAGLGRLAIPLIARGARVVALDIDATNVDALKTLDLTGAHLSDFTLWARQHQTAKPFRAVVMNPPFTKGQDVAHIQLAWTLLAPAGRLVAICGEGVFIRSDRVATGFRAWLAEIGADTEPLPSGTFQESGTSVSTRLITAVRP